MRKPHIILQTWPFNCLTCQHAWESVYEAWHADDGHGGQVVTWRHKGTASMPPWIDPSCPACSSLRVKTLPPGARPSAERTNGTNRANGAATAHKVDGVNGAGGAERVDGGDGAESNVPR